MHEHPNGACPVTGKTHTYCPPQKGDLRSVCPALNTMANHGYIPRDGRNLTFSVLYRGLKACYGLTSSLSAFLVIGGFIAIGRSPVRIPYLSNLFHIKNPDGSISRGGVVDLHLIGLHERVEHDASLVHLNTLPHEKYPPVEIQETWVPQLVGDIQPPVPGYPPAAEGSSHYSRSSTASESDSSSKPSSYYASAFNVSSLQTIINDPEYMNILVDEADVGRMRARRQKDILPKKLDPVHAEIARGEMAIILGVWTRKHGEKTGIPLPWLLQWLSEERMPEVPAPGARPSDTEHSESGSARDSNNSAKTNASSCKSTSTSTMMWRPNPKQKQSLRNTVKRSKAIRTVTEAIEAGHV